VIEIGRRRRNQPAPPHVMYEALTTPDRDPSRRWLTLLAGEQPPQVVRSHAPSMLVWSSIWSERPDAIIEFDLPASADGGTDVTWVLRVEEPAPDEASIRRMRKRLNQLINANLRHTFGQ
jgi:hypothetical protein